MSDDIMVNNCAPTLAGIKTGSLFSCQVKTDQELWNTIRRWNGRLKEKGLRVLPLRFRNGKALIYVFRPQSLRKDLCREESFQILQQNGYLSAHMETCLKHLIFRLRTEEQFPHEIGLFLGYPPEDVKGFIDNKAGNYKCIGYWKVYGNVNTAQKLFQSYKTCKEIYTKLYRKGTAMEELAVAI